MGCRRMEVTYLLLTIACNVCNGCNRQPEHDIRKNDNVPAAAVGREPMPRSNLLRRRGSRPQIVNESDASVATEILYGVVTELQASSRGVPLRSCVRRASLKLYEDVIALTPFADEVRFLD